MPYLLKSKSWGTKDKKAILANDPHIEFAQPSVWYQAHITLPDYEIYGFHLGLTPFPLLAHNRDFAYGLTMFENDDIDAAAARRLTTILLIMPPPGGEEEERNAEANRAAIIIVARNNLISYLSLSLSLRMLFSLADYLYA